MKKIIFLFIVIFSTALFGCNESSENKIPSAGSVRGKTLDIEPYGSKTDLKESQAPSKNSTAGTVRGKTMDIEPFEKKDEKQQIIINSGGRSDQIKNFTFN